MRMQFTLIFFCYFLAVTDLVVTTENQKRFKKSCQYQLIFHKLKISRNQTIQVERRKKKSTGIKPRTHTAKYDFNKYNKPLP